MRAPETIGLEPGTLDGVVPSWLALASERGGSYFQTPDWILSWWETLARKPQTTLAIWRDPSGEPSSIVAVSRERLPLHRTLPMSSSAYVNAGSGPGAADHCGPLVSPGDEDDVRGWLSDVGNGTTLLLRHVGAATGNVVPASARPIETSVCPRLTLSPGDEVGRSSNFRHQLRSYRRRLARDGVVFDWKGPGQVGDSVLRALFELHRRRRAGDPTSFSPDQIAFHRSLIERSDRTRGPAAIVARQSDRPIGVLYGFRWADTFYAYQKGWDPAWERRSLGSVLLHEAITSARSDGARIFDFLRGAEPYKYRFGAADVVDSTWLLPTGFGGWTLRWKYGAKRLVNRSERSSPASETSDG